MCLPRAVYRKTERALETVWHDRPFACMCEGNTPADLIECASKNYYFGITEVMLLLTMCFPVDIATGGNGRGFSLSTMLFFLMLSIFGVMVRLSSLLSSSLCFCVRHYLRVVV